MSDVWSSSGEVGVCNSDVLIVDNDDRIVELVAWFLRKRGYRVRTASSFEEARVLILEAAPDLMLSDVDLGAENALEEVPRLATEGLLPPTLIVSGYLDAATVETLERHGQVLGTLAKPFDFAVLEGRIVDCLRALPAAPAAAVASVPTMHETEDAARAVEDDDEDDDGWIEILPATRSGALPGPSLSQREGGLAPFRLR
ncbi:MAG: response regulator [bacterium]|nr:response regulator [bacterium]